MAGAQRALFGVGRHVRALARVLLGGAHVDERVAEVREHVVLVGADGCVVALDDRVFDGRTTVPSVVYSRPSGFPLVAAAVEKAHVFVAEEREHPQGVGGPPVVLVAVDRRSSCRGEMPLEPSSFAKPRRRRSRARPGR